MALHLETAGIMIRMMIYVRLCWWDLKVCSAVPQDTLVRCSVNVAVVLQSSLGLLRDGCDRPMPSSLGTDMFISTKELCSQGRNLCGVLCLNSYTTSHKIHVWLLRYVWWYTCPNLYFNGGNILVVAFGMGQVCSQACKTCEAREQRKRDLGWWSRDQT